MYFADFLASVGGQALIDCYLAVEVNYLCKINVRHYESVVI